MRDVKQELRRGLSRYRVKALAKRAIRARLNPLLVKCFSARNYDLRQTLVVAGGTRSGSTWLAELVGTIPSSAVLFEPLHVANVPEAAAAGFTWRTFVRPGEEWPEGEAFLERVLQGKIINWQTTSHMGLRSAIHPKTWVVKFVHANLLLGWMLDKFPIRPPALIIRHPCATVVSRSQQAWKPPCHPPCIPKFLETYPQFTNVLEELTDVVEFRAALWCIDYFAPLALPRPYPFHIVAYEQLVRDGRRELSRLFNRWEIELPAQARERLTVCSQTTQKHSHLHGGEDPLGGWRERLPPDQIAKVLRVVEAFGLDFYTDALEPDYDRLYGDHPLGILPTACNVPDRVTPR